MEPPPALSGEASTIANKPSERIPNPASASAPNAEPNAEPHQSKKRRHRKPPPSCSELQYGGDFTYAPLRVHPQQQHLFRELGKSLPMELPAAIYFVLQLLKNLQELTHFISSIHRDISLIEHHVVAILCACFIRPLFSQLELPLRVIVIL